MRRNTLNETLILSKVNESKHPSSFLSVLVKKIKKRKKNRKKGKKTCVFLSCLHLIALNVSIAGCHLTPMLAAL